MLYLSDDIYFSYDFSTSAPVGSTLEFRIEKAPIPFSNYEPIYYGRIYVLGGNQRIYLNDIISTNMSHHDYITPEVQTDQFGAVTGRVKKYLDYPDSIISIKVIFPSINLTRYFEPIVQYYKDVNVPRVEWSNDFGDSDSDSVYNLLDLRPVNVLPHIPSLWKPTTNFWVGYLIARNLGAIEHSSDEITLFSDAGEIYSYPNRGAGVIAGNETGDRLFDLCNRSHLYPENREQLLQLYHSFDDFEISTPLATIDLCPSRYYLIWMDRTGAYQCQRFNKKVIHSENITNTDIANYLDEIRPVVKEVKDAWVVNSDWLTEQEYKCYESIFVSPYLYLYDTQTDEGYWVNITNKSWTEKTKQNNKKPYNLTLNLESNRSQKIVY